MATSEGTRRATFATRLRPGAGLAVVLVVQAVTTFIFIPLSVHQLAFTAVCNRLPVRSRPVQSAPATAPSVLVSGHLFPATLLARLGAPHVANDRLDRGP